MELRAADYSLDSACAVLDCAATAAPKEGAVQRLLSLATLTILGGLGYLFLQGGGLDQVGLSPNPNAPGQPPAADYSTPGPWNAPAGGAPGTPTYPTSTTTAGNYPSLADGPTIRLASFNIQVFGQEKASKLYVMDALAQIIRQFDIVAIQEIRSQDQYLIPNFIKLVNQTGRRFDYVIGPRVGYTTVKEQFAYIYDATKIEVDQQSVYTVGDPDGLLHREPLVATFRTRGVDPNEAFTFTLVNVHTDPDDVKPGGENANEMDVMAEVYRVVRRSSRNEDDIIVLGDFNVDDHHLARLGELPGVLPLIAGVATNTLQNAQYDNIIIHRPSTTEYVGRSGVFDLVRFLNRSERQVLEVSDHFPVWAEFSIYERDYTGRVASRQTAVGR